MEQVSIRSIKDDILTIRYKGKRVKINLSKELAINENLINGQLKEQPSNYAFLCLLRDQAIKDRDQLEKEKDAAYSSAWLFYKGNNAINNDAASHKAETNNKYQSKVEQHIEATHKAARLISVCRAFEARERIMQTISSNLRKQQ